MPRRQLGHGHRHMHPDGWVNVELKPHEQGHADDADDAHAKDGRAVGGLGEAVVNIASRAASRTVALSVTAL
jgi:hypothetical protein